MKNKKIMIYVIVAMVIAGVIATQWKGANAEQINQNINPIQAHQKAENKEILIIDIRRPDEWKKTGIAKNAIPIDMRNKNFTQKLRQIMKKTKIEKIALICAKGVRSKWLAKKLAKEGFKNIIDINEGMIGRSKNTGWINRKLPIVKVPS